MYYDERYIITDDNARIFYRVLGEYRNLSILLVHGWASDGRGLETLAKELAKDFRVILPDLRGFGRSEKKPPYTTARMIRDMITLANAENANIFAGHSWGGLIAQEISAILNPKSTILISTFAKLNKPFHSWFFRMMFPIVERMDVKSFLESIAQIAYRRGYKDLEESIKEMLENLDLNVLKESLSDILQFDSTPELSLINSPTIIIHGDRDPIVPVEHAFYLKDNIKNSEIVIIPRQQHNIPRLKAKLVSSIIRGWVASNI